MVPPRDLASPWFLYFHPYSSSVNMYDWWDAGLGCTDVADQVFGRNIGWYTEYAIGASDGLGTPVIPWGRDLRTADGRSAVVLLQCDQMVPAPYYVYWQYEPHGDQLYSGVQNSRWGKRSLGRTTLDRPGGQELPLHRRIGRIHLPLN